MTKPLKGRRPAAKATFSLGDVIVVVDFEPTQEDKGMNKPDIKEHMEVIGADGVHIGNVDRVVDGKIKLTKADSGEGSHKGHHHYVDLGLVAEVEGTKVRLSAIAAVAVAMEEEAPSKSGM
jgi:hypothetical protein